MNYQLEDMLYDMEVEAESQLHKSVEDQEFYCARCFDFIGVEENLHPQQLDVVQLKQLL